MWCFQMSDKRSKKLSKVNFYIPDLESSADKDENITLLGMLIQMSPGIFGSIHFVFFLLPVALWARCDSLHLATIWHEF